MDRCGLRFAIVNNRVKNVQVLLDRVAFTLGLRVKSTRAEE